ncbi:MAG: DUF4476 domain-containing protein [Bacteroidales bacterium]|nr:DUF4476 domain-containing protein [Bacteroidales bacterium]
MKKILFLFSLVIMITGVSAQDMKSYKPMSKFCYKIYTKRISKPKKTEEKRRKKAVRLLKWKHISSNQLYKASLIITDDDQRLVYVKEAYPKITDKSNALLLTNAFEKYLHVELLWEYIEKSNEKLGIAPMDLESYTQYLSLKDKKKDKQRDEVVKPKDKPKEKTEETKTEETKTPDLVEKAEQPAKTDNKEEVKTPVTSPTNSITYPKTEGYAGNTGCESCLNDNQFTAFKNALSKFDTDEEKTKLCLEYVYTYCFSTAQIMQLGELIKTESMRFVFFKAAYEKVYDRDNYLHVKQLLINQSYINGINEIYIVPKVEKPYAEGIPSPCVLSNNDYEQIKTNIRRELSTRQKLETAKNLIAQYKCISSQQVKSMLNLFSLETDKLDFAKFAYKYCNDKNNYSVVSSFFTSLSSKNELNEYVKKYKE